MCSASELSSLGTGGSAGGFRFSGPGRIVAEVAANLRSAGGAKESGLLGAGIGAQPGPLCGGKRTGTGSFGGRRGTRPAMAMTRKKCVPRPDQGGGIAEESYRAKRSGF